METTTGRIYLSNIWTTISTSTVIRELQESDIKGLNSLPPADWKFDYEAFIKRLITDDFFHAFVIMQDEQIIGTGNVLVKGKVGWLSNIIISEAYRGKGLGYKMTKFLVDFVYGKGCETQLLIATALGASVYKKIGFKKTSEYLCFDSEVDMDLDDTSSIRALKDADLEDVYKLDREANDEDRVHLIDKYSQNGYGYFNEAYELTGVYLPEFASGLVLSRDNQAGPELLKFKHAKKGRRTRLPADNKDGINFLESLGLKKGENFSRMALGKEIKWNPKLIYSYGGGYCG